MILDGKSIAEKNNNDLKIKIQELSKKAKRFPMMVIIQVGDNPASNSYIKSKLKACSDVGIIGVHKHFDERVTSVKLEKEIRKLNKNKKVDGIIIQLPLPKHLDETMLTNTIDFEKDIDGFHLINKGLLSEGKEAVRAATPQGIINLLDAYKIDVSGMNAVVVGRSNIVGIPISKMLLDRNATVTTCHSKTKDLKAFTSGADILIVAIGRAKFITVDMVKEGAIVIDVGINRVDKKLYGDVDFDSVKDKAKYITPVPKGVGPMTVSALLENTFKVFSKKYE